MLMYNMLSSLFHQIKSFEHVLLHSTFASACHCRAEGYNPADDPWRGVEQKDNSIRLLFASPTLVPDAFYFEQIIFKLLWCSLCFSLWSFISIGHTYPHQWYFIDECRCTIQSLKMYNTSYSRSNTPRKMIRILHPTVTANMHTYHLWIHGSSIT